MFLRGTRDSSSLQPKLIIINFDYFNIPRSLNPLLAREKHTKYHLSKTKLLLSTRAIFLSLASKGLIRFSKRNAINNLIAFSPLAATQELIEGNGLGQAKS
jgi:hypothetical protein